MAKSERERQKAADKKKRKAQARAARAFERAQSMTLEAQIARVCAICGGSGEIVEQLALGSTPSQVSDLLTVSLDDVKRVEQAFLKLPSGIQDLVIQYPASLKNPHFVDALKFAQKAVRRGSSGHPADIDEEDKLRLHRMLSGE